MTDLICVSCKRIICPDELCAVCDTCKNSFHLSCWQQAKKCPVNGCIGKIDKIVKCSELLSEVSISITSQDATAEVFSDDVVEPITSEEPECFTDELIEPVADDMYEPEVDELIVPITDEAPESEYEEIISPVFEEKASEPEGDEDFTNKDEFFAPHDNVRMQTASYGMPVNSDSINGRRAVNTEYSYYAPPVVSPVKKKKKRRAGKIIALILGLFFAFSIFLIVGLVAVYFISPLNNYFKAKSLLNNGEYEEALVELEKCGDFLDASELVDENNYYLAVSYLDNGEYEIAIEKFESLGSYSDSAELLMESRYLLGCQYYESEEYKLAYNLFAETIGYSDSDKKLNSTILMWCTDAVNSDYTYEAEAFAETVKIDNNSKELIYTSLCLFFTGREEIDYWFDNGPTSHTKSAKLLFEMLPSSYENTTTYISLLNAFENEVMLKNVYSNHKDVMEDCASLPVVKSIISHDDVILYFLEGYWASSYGSYYMNFYKDQNGGISVTYNVPWVAEPDGTRYYSIENLSFYFEDTDSNKLAVVYRFEIVSFDKIKVYSYKNGNTYTLTR